MQKFVITLCLLAFAAAALAAPATTPIRAVKPVSGSETPVFLGSIADPATYPRTPSSLDVGTQYQCGTTWYDYQHNGSSGKMVSVDEMGFVHITWTNGLDSLQQNRHVFYNVWDPTTETFLMGENGVQANSSTRGGYTCGTVLANGFYFPTYHQELTGGEAHTAVAIDFLPQTGAFTGFEPCYLYQGATPMEIIWPKIAKDINGVLHVVSCENPIGGAAGDPQRIYYSRGHPVFTDGFGLEITFDEFDDAVCFDQLDTVMVISPDVACSRSTDRVVIAWADSRDDLTSDTATQRNNDLVYIVSEDGGLNWGERVNVTNFIEPDWECASQDTPVCDMDTFRIYTDLSVILDEDDDAHIAFTTTCYYSLEGTVSRYASQIWHWGEDDGFVTPICALSPAWIDTNWADDFGDWQYGMQRPNLAIDTETGALYCAFVWADSANWSEGGIPMQDIWISKSEYNGNAWTMPLNVTNTNTGQFVPPGESAHERDATLAETITDWNGERWLHMSFVFDRDAGGAVGDNPTGTPTLNPVFYHRINIDEIPSWPLWNPLWPFFHVDSTDAPLALDDVPGELPSSFTLYQNYPNPFNPSTNIQFDLVRAGNVTLSVFNLLGQEVATLLNNELRSAGTHVMNFDASNLSSGVYLYTLKAEGITQTRKMILMK
ncbi:T9SS type A sorting domain-containing protein [bacterium]|nr:T9SS type A sorting domain-containing protein [bacterium]